MYDARSHAYIEGELIYFQMSTLVDIININ